MNGLIVVNKEQNITSFGVCSRIRKITNEKKVGHTGTLDPMACGVLVVTLGKATSVADYISDGDKEYVAGIKFGLTTDTLDTWGETLSVCEPSFNEEEFRKVINSFIGNITQVTPAYSAAKKNGKHLYEYARRGEKIELPERHVTIYNIEIIKMNLPYSAVIKVRCSKGTYIRSLCNDIGKALNCGAVMSSLIRTYACGFDIKSAHTLSEIESLYNKGEIDKFLLESDYPLTHLKRIDINEIAAKKLLCGNFIRSEECLNLNTGYDFAAEEKVRLYADNVFTAIAIYDDTKKGFQPKKMFV